MFGKKIEQKALDATRGSSVAATLVTWLVIIVLLLGNLKGYWGAIEDYKTEIDRVVISLALLVLIVSVFYKEVKSIRSRRFARIQPSLHAISHSIRDISTVLEVLEEEEQARGKYRDFINSSFERAATSFANSFSILTGIQCRASIKLIYFEETLQGERQAFVSTFVRDQESSSIQQRDDHDRQNNNYDAIEENTDFNLLWRRKVGCFFSNNLPSYHGYENSSYPKIEDRDISGWRGLVNFFVPLNWPASYRSTIVWPIQKRALPTIDESEDTLIGFLTIDCESRGVFRYRTDFEFGAAVADALYPPIRRLQRLQVTADTGNLTNEHEEEVTNVHQ